jgi:hypothetical protein
MQGNGDDKVSCEGLAIKTLLQDVAKRFGKGHAIGVLQMVNDFPQRTREQQRGAREIENVFALDAQTAQTFDCGCRFAALNAKRRLQRYQTRPTFRTCPSPPALRNLSVTMDTRDWEQEIENVVEQSAFGETQRANSVYRSERDNKAQNFKFFISNMEGCE